MPSYPGDMSQMWSWRASNRIQCLISKECEDKDCPRYVKQLKQDGKPVDLYCQHYVYYYYYCYCRCHDNASEQALRKFAETKKILHGNRSYDGAWQTKILMSVYAMCKQLGVNFYQFVQDCLADNIKPISPDPTPVQTTVST